MIHFCTMGGTGCCDLSGAGVDQACQDESVPPSGISMKDQSSCYKNSVVGGLNDTQALLEKLSNQHRLNVELVAGAGVRVGDISVFHGNTPLSFHCTKVSPPSVEKYVLTGAFLI